MDERVRWPDGTRCAVMLTFDFGGDQPPHFDLSST
jgi:hypothetical protein